MDQGSRTASSSWRAFVDPYVVLKPLRNAVGYTIDFTFLDANPVACESLGRSSDELLVLRLTDVLPRRLADGLIDAARQVLDTGQALALRDFVYAPEPTADIESRFDVRVVRLDDAVGFTWRAASRRTADAVALADSEQRYRLLAENASDIVYQTDANGCIRWISPSVQRLLGWHPTELLGTPGTDLTHEDEREAALGRRHVALRGGELAIHECRFRTTEGGTRWMSVHVHSITDPDGRTTGAVIGLRDIEAEVEVREQLRDSEQRYRLLAENASDEVLLITADGVVEWASPTVTNYEEMVGTTVWNLVHPDDRAQLEELLGEAASTSEVRGPVQFRVFNHLSEYEWVSATGHGIVSDGHPGRVVVALRDVDVEVRAHQQLRESESRYRLLVENATDAVAHSRDGLILWVSPGLTDMLGWSPEHWVGHRVEEFVYPDDLHLVSQARNSLGVGTAQTLRLRMFGEDGRHHWIEVHMRPYVDQYGVADGAAVSFRVVDNEVAAEQELERRARYDELTGLLNRKEALDRLGVLRRREPIVGHELAVLFCDIDRFKTINDTFGHAAGDELLRVTADRLRANTRQADLIARLGGDELLVVLDGVHDLAEATRVAGKLRRRVSDPVPFGDGSIVATMSVGVTLALSGENEDAVIARADAALYEAKHSGRDQVVAFTPRH